MDDSQMMNHMFQIETLNEVNNDSFDKNLKLRSRKRSRNSLFPRFGLCAVRFSEGFALVRGLLVICLTFLNAWEQMLSVGQHFSEKRVHAYFTCSKFSEVGKSLELMNSQGWFLGKKSRVYWIEFSKEYRSENDSKNCQNSTTQILGILSRYGPYHMD